LSGVSKFTLLRKALKFAVFNEENAFPFEKRPRSGTYVGVVVLNRQADGGK